MPCPHLLECDSEVDGKKFKTICTHSGNWAKCWKYREKYIKKCTPRNWLKALQIRELDLIYTKDFDLSDRHNKQ